MPTKPTVLELIQNRLQQNSSPGNRQDPWKLAIAVEGGGMKWVVAAGILSRLEHHGIQPDLLVGTSSGGVAAAYYAAGHVRHGSTLLRHLNRKGYHRQGGSHRAVNLWRSLHGQPVIDIENMVELAINQLVPLNWDALRQTAIPTFMTAVSSAGELHLQPLHDTHYEAQKTILKNTARLPVATHHAADPDVLWDGMLKASLPVQQAFTLGATHVLAVKSNGAGPVQVSAMWKAILLALGWQNRSMRNLVRQAVAQQQQDQQALPQMPDTLVVGLPRVTIGVAEDDERKLFLHLLKGYRHAGTALNLPQAHLPAEWHEDTALYL